MTRDDPEYQLFRLTSDNTSVYQDAWKWFLDQGADMAPVLVEGLDNQLLGSVAHWRILLILRELALPSTLPAILKSLRRALQENDPIVLPGALEAVAAFSAEHAVPPLDSILNSQQFDGMKHAAALLAKIGGDSAVTSLAKLLRHPRPDIRQSAVQALLKLNSDSAREAIKRHRDQELDRDIRALMNSVEE